MRPPAAAATAAAAASLPILGRRSAASASASASGAAIAAASASALPQGLGGVQTRRRASTSGSSSSGASSGTGGRRDHRVPLLVGGSLVGAGSLQYYLHQRALATGGSAAAAAHTAAAAAAAAAAAGTTTTGLQRRALSSTSTPSSSGGPTAPGGPASPPSSSPPSPPPPPRVQAPSLWRRGVATQASSQEGAGTKNPLEGLEITIYQYKICPFCCKVKGVLDFFKVPYSTLDVNPLTKSEIKFSANYRKVPIARLGGTGPDGGEVVPESDKIVERVATLLRQAHAAPAKDLDAFFSPEAARWAAWADGQLAVLLFPNITRTFAESHQAFSYVHDVPHFSLLDKLANQWVGATAMWAAQGKIKKKYGIADERAALKGALDDWAAQVGGANGKAGGFLGGATPNLGDVAVYGCLRAIEGMDAWKEIMAENPTVAEWYGRVEAAIGASACVKAE